MKKKLVAVAMTVVVAFGLMACSGGDTGKNTQTQDMETDKGETSEKVTITEEGKESEESYVIGYAPATLNNAFWLAVLDGVQAAIDERGLNVKLVQVDANGDQAIMNERISELINTEMDALLCAPADSTAVTSALEQLDAANIPVINFDTPVDATDLVETIIASDNYNAGYVAGEDAAGKIEDGAKILVLHSPRASACVERYDGFIAALDESGKEYNVVNVLDGEGAQETSLRLAADALVADPDLSVIFAVNDPSAMGAVNAIDQADVILENKILVYGVDGNPDAKVMIKANKMEGTGAQSPETLGYTSMMAAFDFLEGKTLEKEVVVDTFLISKDNVEEYGTDGWQ